MRKALLTIIGVFLIGSGDASAQGKCDLLSSIDKLEIERTTVGDAKVCPTPVVEAVRDPFVGVSCQRGDGAAQCKVHKPSAEEIDAVRCGHFQTPAIRSLEDMAAEAVVTLWTARGTCTTMPPTTVPLRTIHIGIKRVELCYQGSACISLQSFEPANWARLFTLGADATMRALLKGLGQLPGMRI